MTVWLLAGWAVSAALLVWRWARARIELASTRRELDSTKVELFRADATLALTQRTCDNLRDVANVERQNTDRLEEELATHLRDCPNADHGSIISRLLQTERDRRSS